MHNLLPVHCNFQDIIITTKASHAFQMNERKKVIFNKAVTAIECILFHFFGQISVKTLTFPFIFGEV